MYILLDFKDILRLQFQFIVFVLFNEKSCCSNNTDRKDTIPSLKLPVYYYY